VVAGERGRIRLDDLIGDDDDVAIAAITVAELLVGVELADAAHRPRRS
jgi:tRNA(fMet)-specific endonuclease VapC